MRPRLAATMLLAVSVILLAVWCGLFSGNPAEGPPQAVTSPHRGRAGKSVDGDSKQDLADRPEDRTGSNPLVTAERSAEVGSFEEDATSGLPAPFISFEELDPKDRELVKGDPAEAILFEAHDGMWGQLVAYRKIPEPPGWELAELTDEEYRFALELAERRNSLREAQDSGLTNWRGWARCASFRPERQTARSAHTVLPSLDRTAEAAACENCPTGRLLWSLLFSFMRFQRSLGLERTSRS